MLAQEKISKLAGFGEHAIVESIKKNDAELEAQSKLLDQCEFELKEIQKAQKDFKKLSEKTSEDLKFLKDSILRCSKDAEKMHLKFKENLQPFCKSYIKAWKKRENIEELLLK